ncbi:MAG: hypothetical protein NTY32_05640, partial [Bacteroidia bacterium]|nr:hypothetical protein [Bacteroidia bacterium]
MTSKQIKAIFNGDITNWKDVGGKDQAIQLFTIDELSSAYTEEQLGSNFENIPACVNDYFSKNDNLFGFFESSRFPAHFVGRKLEVPKITVWEFLTGRQWYPTSVPIWSAMVSDFGSNFQLWCTSLNSWNTFSDVDCHSFCTTHRPDHRHLYG